MVKNFSDHRNKWILAIVFVIFALGNFGQLVTGFLDYFSSSDKHKNFAASGTGTAISANRDVTYGDRSYFNNTYNIFPPEQSEAELKRKVHGTDQEIASQKPLVSQAHRTYSTPNDKRNITLNHKDNYVEKELFDKNLLKNLHDANKLYKPDDEELALQLYKGVLDQLSTDARNALDQKLRISANKDYHDGKNPDAIEKYRLIFRGY
ncbi:MAG: hypothetical protein WAW61_16015 [Methylococcaceae bacterium]